MKKTSEIILGIDIGGTGTKLGLVDVTTGQLVTERIKHPTPTPSTPQNVLSFIQKKIEEQGWKGKIGCGIPAIVKNGIAKSAANIDDSWIDFNVEEFLGHQLGEEVTIINDADAAGLAEMTFGAGKNQQGLVLLLTIGTGIGSAMFCNGTLIPNSELGHTKFKGSVAEDYASNVVRIRTQLSWAEWGFRLNELLHYYERICSPDLFIIGGGVSKHLHLFQNSLNNSSPVVAAQLQNAAGVVGAAMAVNYLKEK